MSFEGELAPSFDLRCLRAGATLPDGWGIGFYPGGEPSASVLKEPAPPRASIRSEIVKTWEHVASSVFLLHIRSARWGQNTDANTQPFLRSHGGRDFLAAHSGSLKRRFSLSPAPRYEPVGSTDTELIFCELLNRLAEHGKRGLAEVLPETLQGWFDELNDHGTLSMVLTDGKDLVLYADKREESRLHTWQLFPPYERVVFGDAELEVDLTKRGPKSRKGVLVASEPLAEVPGVLGGPLGLLPRWEPVLPGELVILRQGAIAARVAPRQPKASIADVRTSVPRLVVSRPEVATAKTFRIVHATTYRYASDVQRSQHMIRLAPFHDRLQEVRHHDLEVSVEGQVVDYDDVFGNRVRRVNFESPWRELRLVARSQVRVFDIDPLGASVHRRSTIPLVWMPWQRQVLQPFLLPPELPDSQLTELSEYAMSFVERNDYDLLDTLLDLNHTIYKEYVYEKGSSTLATTAFDTYQARKGVCQDFANLFICLARLLSVPARYVCGYVYTGNNNPNQAQGDASHAWVQVYLPQTGWKGFDPTNGILTQTDHVRVAVGRNYVDATPTSGTIYLGGGDETMSVEVRVECDT